MNNDLQEQSETNDPIKGQAEQGQIQEEVRQDDAGQVLVRGKKPGKPKSLSASDHALDVIKTDPAPDPIIVSATPALASNPNIITFDSLQYPEFVRKMMSQGKNKPFKHQGKTWTPYSDNNGWKFIAEETPFSSATGTYDHTSFI